MKPAPAPTLSVRHDPSSCRFEAEVDGLCCVVDYALYGCVMHLQHTGVPAKLQGRGIAAQLVAAALAHARAHGLRVRPLCSYVRVYLRRHPESQSLLEAPR